MNLFLLILFLILFSVAAMPQSGILQNDDCLQTPKKLSANAIITTGVDYSTNAFYGQNSNLTRYYLFAEPQVTIASLPFKTSFFITSENGAFTQNLSGFGISFDVKGYQDHLKQKMKCKLENDNSYQRSLSRSKEMNQKLDSLNTQSNDLNMEKENIGMRSAQMQSWKDSGYALSYEQKYEYQSIQQRQAEIDKQLNNLHDQKAAVVAQCNKMNSYNNSLSNPSSAQIGDELKNRGSALKGPEKFFLNTERLGIGKISLNYSELMLNGAVVEGGEFTFSPKTFSAGFAAGKTRFTQLFSLPTNSIPSLNYRPFLQDAFFTTGHFGFGRSEEAHLHFRYLRVLDNGNANIPAGANDVVGANFQIPIIKYIKVDGEFAHAFYSTDKNASPIQNKSSDILSSIHKENISTKKGNAYLLKAKFEKSGLNISAKARYLEPGYHTLGVYFMNRSHWMTDEKISYKLKTLPAAVSFSHSWLENSSVDLYSSKSIFEKYNGTLTLTPKNLPSWSISHTRYSYYAQNGGNGSTGKMLTVTTAHNYKILNTACTSLISGTGQKTESIASSDANTIQSLFYSLTAQQNIRLSKAIISSGATLNKTVTANIETYSSFANTTLMIPIAKKHQLEISGKANFMNQQLYRVSEGGGIGMQLSKNFLFKIKGEYIHWLSGINNSYQTGAFAGSAMLTVQL